MSRWPSWLPEPIRHELIDLEQLVLAGESTGVTEVVGAARWLGKALGELEGALVPMRGGDSARNITYLAQALHGVVEAKSNMGRVVRLALHEQRKGAS